ncbi:hypothetical protein CONCODRAFT_70134 [Conidiobolus coronatus NRRL 28638]|uniref:Uncharacterized protein n=1 Tax=Conidiobolus coronatus (strain ATCC 28846 / CBS 209.66 / NRRL 28638) TaxID=796925 RepID=A0A137P7W7_CONC2|nr:hypothetical protein CONCODRAFT_70134 [Conidiobolus coronatus NRRL 28638]|eukprot:KXN71069.1 hypothetical protein CONCODRAFT_70134 [Conidiobolus coronatus NRRL 28638]
MKLTTFLIPLTLVLSASCQHNHGSGSDVNFGTHQPGSGTLIGNIYMHTLGHFVSDFPKYIMDLAKTGDIFGFLMTLIKFVLYHNPINLLQDIGGGIVNQVKGGKLV